MENLIKRARTFPTVRGDVTALEYGIIASILGLLVVTIFTDLGAEMKTLFTSMGWQ